MQSLELLLDPESEARIVAEWRALEAAGLPSQARHTGASNRPHVTVLARPMLPLDIDDLDSALPLRVTIGAPLVFGRAGRCTVARVVVPTIPLLDIHRRLHACVGAGDDAPHSLPTRCPVDGRPTSPWRAARRSTMWAGSSRPSIRLGRSTPTSSPSATGTACRGSSLRSPGDADRRRRADGQTI